jgi:DNA-binding transcriptional ArsR family regulator
MAGLLPSKPDIDPSDEPRVVGLDSDDADELIDALSSDTTRAVLAALHDEPGSASDLADRVDTSLQNVQYHLGKLQDAGLVEVGDTVYSEKGREMDVYTPADRALVVVAGQEEETAGLRAALSRLLGGIGVLGVASVVVDRLARRGLSLGFGAGAGGTDGGGGTDGAEGADGVDSGGGSGDDGGSAADATPTPGSERAADTGDGGAAADGAATTAASEAPTAEPATPTTGTGTGTETTADGGFEIAEVTTTTTGPRATASPVETVTEATTAVPTREPTVVEAATAAETSLATRTTTAMQPTTTAAPTPTPTATATATPTGTGSTADLTANAVGTAVGSRPSLLDGLASSPGLLFFLGGTTVLVGGFALWWVSR